jgi:hypothetical protein
MRDAKKENARIHAEHQRSGLQSLLPVPFRSDIDNGAFKTVKDSLYQ